MLRKIFFVVVFVFLFVFSFFSFAKEDWKCIQLNTDMPFIGDKIGDCTGENGATGYWKVTEENAFPQLIWWMSKLTISFIIIFSFLFLVAGGILISLSWADQSMYSKWKEMILKVIIWIALLGLAWVILHIINPNFFK